MSFIDSAMDLLARTEGSLDSLIADAVKAKAYREVAAIAALAESLSAIAPGRSVGRRGADLGATSPVPPEPVKVSAEPSWMRPKG